MALHHVECFKTGKLPRSKTGEFKRQLIGQEAGLNGMTVEEFLATVTSPNQRNPSSAREARTRYEEKFEKRSRANSEKTQSFGC